MQFNWDMELILIKGFYSPYTPYTLIQIDKKIGFPGLSRHKAKLMQPYSTEIK